MNLPLSKGGRRYGFKTSPNRFGVSALHLGSPLPVPPSADLEAWMGPVKDQGQEGSCTAHAGSENLEYLFRKFKNQSPIFSPQFLYYCERDMDGSLSQGDCGSFGLTSVKCMNAYGVCTLASDPYDPSQMNTPPTDAQWAEAKTYKSGAYHAIMSVDTGKQCLASGYTFLIGFNVYENFETDISSNGIMPAPSGEIIGGHEVLVIGYDDNKTDSASGRTGYYKIRNSWGNSWGDKGNFYMSYADFMKVMTEGWIQHFGKPW